MASTVQSDTFNLEQRKLPRTARGHTPQDIHGGYSKSQITWKNLMWQTIIPSIFASFKLYLYVKAKNRVESLQYYKIFSSFPPPLDKENGMD